MASKSLEHILSVPHNLILYLRSIPYAPLTIVFAYQTFGGAVGGFVGTALSGFSGNEEAITLGMVVGMLGGALLGYYRVNKK